ncbi:hypothetical protein T459_15930 [Capsicum annuum]|uniref:Disease resistance protein winged helix domain-containing protein n=1 Tax=Capsicum annuum TaxID=4072 RepID=A0A2G2Z796_CAPAN|nr:hypothetical protein T459_15930 [Capsicum annuum]
MMTRQKEVAFHGKCNTDPLNLRMLRPEASLENKRVVWLEVQNNLNSFIFSSEVDVMKVIELSYDHLPHHLKTCFLYLASYLKDSAMDRDMLKMYWRAEGLVEQIGMKSVKEVMEIYLDNLISCSLVIAFNEIGGYPTFQLHDLVLDFCLIKAREEKLFGQISSSDPSSSSDLMPRIVDIFYDKEHFEDNNFILFSSKMKGHFGKHLYSLEITGDNMEDRLSDACHLRDLRLLSVLILGSSFMMVKDSLLNEMGMLNYLSIGTEVRSLPSSFSNLWNLETLMVENKGSTLVLLPSIWDLVKLRLLSMIACSLFDLDTNVPILRTKDSKFENLRVLENLVLSYSKDLEDIFIRFPNLQELVFILKESWDYSTKQYWFPKLDFLTKLDFLREDFESSNTNDSGPSVVKNWSCDFNLPLNLKKLWGMNGTWGRKTPLRISNFLATWKVEENTFPILEKLGLRGCHMLEEIPPSFSDIFSLKIIKLEESPQLEVSAKKIKQYIEDLGGEELQALGPNNIPHVLLYSFVSTLIIRPKRTLDEGVMVNLSPSRKTPSFLSLVHRGEGVNDDGQFLVRLRDGGASWSGPNSHSSIYNRVGRPGLHGSGCPSRPGPSSGRDKLEKSIIPLRRTIYQNAQIDERDISNAELRHSIHILTQLVVNQAQQSKDVGSAFVISEATRVGGTPLQSDIPRVVWNPSLTQRGIPQPMCAARVGVPESDTPQGSRPV